MEAVKTSVLEHYDPPNHKIDAWWSLSASPFLNLKRCVYCIVTP